MNSPSSIPASAETSTSVPATEFRAATAAAPRLPRPTLWEIFAAFAAISLAGFGGVLAWARRMMVEERKWMSPEQFNETYALCAFLPGGNIINFSVIFGSRLRGAPGSVAALTGLLGPPMILIIIIGAIYAHYGDLPMLRRMLTGVAAAAAGLMMATVAKMARPLFRNRVIVAPLIAIATFLAVGIMHWPLPLVLLVLVPVSIGNAWVRP
jgi:chromate transporter